MENIIKKIQFKKRAAKKDFLAFSNWMDSRGQLLSEGVGDDGRFFAVCVFEDMIDYLAFLAAAGFVEVSPYWE